MTFFSSWRTALRIAAREARRAKGRSALVVAMIALPALALSFAAATYDMATLTRAERATQTMGAADARIQWPSRQPVMQMPDPADGWMISVSRIAPPPDTSTGVTSPAGDSRGGLDERDLPGTEADLRAALPDSTVLPLQQGFVTVQTPAGLGQSVAVMVDATSPLTRGYVEVLAGRAPGAPTEVALTEQAMAWLNAPIGSTVTVHVGQSTRDFTVVGQVEFPWRLDRTLLFAYDDAATGELFPASERSWFPASERSWLVDTPEPIGWDRVLELNEQGMVVASWAVLIDPPPDEAVPLNQYWSSSGELVVTEELAVGVLVAGLALLEVVLLAGPAFAVGARRRQRQLALVAANGGTPAHLRRIVLADGVVLGLIGAGAGIVLGVAAAFAARPVVEETLLHARAGGYRVFPEALVAVAGLAVVTGLLAAMVPAFTAARQNVVAALAARRGVTRSRKRWIAVGVVMVGVGAAVAAGGAVLADSTVLVAGLVLAELGLVVGTPALVGLVARAGRVLPLAPRIALRDASRNRAAAAPAISAVMAAVAGSVTIAMIMDTDREDVRAQSHPDLPVGTVSVLFREEPGSAGVEQAIRSTLPVTEVHRVGWPGCSVNGAIASCFVRVLYNDLCPELARWQAGDTSDSLRAAAAANPHCDRQMARTSGGVVVDGGAAVAALTGASGDDLRRARETLAAGGVVVRSPLQITDGEATLAVVRPDPDASAGPDSGRGSDLRPPAPGSDLVYVPPGHTMTTVTVPGYLLTTGIGPGSVIIPPQLVERLGLDVNTKWLVAATARPPTEEEMERFTATMRALDALGMVQTNVPYQTDPRLLVLVAAAALVTLGAAAIGTGLAAADGRADLSTLAAVGASPRLRRALSVSQAWVIAGLGSLLGSVVGIGAALAVIHGNNQQDWRLWPGAPAEPMVPWPTLAVVLVAVPLMAILGAGLLTRSRLPIERRL
jgi:putative ABC transport system permease protein